MQTYDPWERMNRFTYRFNTRFDEAVFLPVANVYRKLPTPVQAGVHNFVANLTEVISTLNYAAQLRPAPGVRSLGRFVINSTLGIGGLFDVATRMKIPAARTGFGATLARWGVHPGPYLVLPLLGPYTLRDGFGFLADFGTAWAINIPPVYQGTIGWFVTPIALVDTRSNNGLPLLRHRLGVRVRRRALPLRAQDPHRGRRHPPVAPQRPGQCGGGSRPMSALGPLAASLLMLALSAWTAAALWFQAPAGPQARQLLIGLWLLFSLVAAVGLWRGHGAAALLAFGLAYAALLLWWHYP